MHLVFPFPRLGNPQTRETVITLKAAIILFKCLCSKGALWLSNCSMPSQQLRKIIFSPETFLNSHLTPLHGILLTSTPLSRDRDNIISLFSFFLQALEGEESSFFVSSNKEMLRAAPEKSSRGLMTQFIAPESPSSSASLLLKLWGTSSQKWEDSLRRRRVHTRRRGDSQLGGLRGKLGSLAYGLIQLPRITILVVLPSPSFFSPPRPQFLWPSSKSGKFFPVPTLKKGSLPLKGARKLRYTVLELSLSFP